MPGTMIKKLIEYLNETKEKTTTEYQRIKRKRGRKLFYWLIIAGLIAAFFLYANDVRSNTKTQTESIHQEFKQLRDEIRFELKKQNIDIDRKLQEQNDRIEGYKQAKAEKARLAMQSARSVTSQRPNVGGNCEQYRPLVSQYSWNVEVALAVMKAESGCNPNAANWGDRHSTCRGSFGLFQIACFDGQVFDPAQNIAIAYRKYQSRAWQPWSVCKTGKVRCI